MGIERSRRILGRGPFIVGSRHGGWWRMIMKWFTKTIVADGPHMAVWVNGYQVSDWTDKRPEKESGARGSAAWGRRDCDSGA